MRGYSVSSKSDMFPINQILINLYIKYFWFSTDLIKEQDEENDNANKEQIEKKPPEKNLEDQKAQENMPTKHEMVLNNKLSNDSCISKIPKIILEFKGVEFVNLDKDKDLMMVKGAVDASKMIQYMKDKLKWNVVVVLSEKDDSKNYNIKEEKQESSLIWFFWKLKESTVAKARRGFVERVPILAAAMCSALPGF